MTADPNEKAPPEFAASAQSGGVNIEGEVAAGRDIVGRDKLEAGGNIVHAEAGATVIIGERVVSVSVAKHVQPAAGEEPFKGLRYFDVQDAHLFFGREQLTGELVRLLREHRFLAIVGASGSGKSSLVRAGLVPALKRGDTGSPPGSIQWPVHIITPTSHPLEVLAASLTRDSESVTATATLIDDLKRDARSLHLYVRKLLSRENANRFLLVVDQFEELFTLCHDQGERKAFVDSLMTATHSETDGPTIVVVTLRADFYNHSLAFDNLHPALEQHQKIVGPMSADELRRAIEEPPLRYGWEFEPGLVDLLLRDAGDEPGALPLLSHALLETWKRREGRTLTLNGYHQSGGVRGAIAKTAEEVFSHLNGQQQALARNIFLRLTELGEGTQDMRRRAALSELQSRTEDMPEIQSVLKILTDARLITTERDTAEVAHEALIREWPTLRKWLNEDREGLHLHRQLTEVVQIWLELKRDPGVLYRGSRLAQTQEWFSEHKQQLNELEREFLEESQNAADAEVNEKEAVRQRELTQAQALAESQRRRATATRWALGVIGVLLILAIGAAFYAISAATLASKRENEATKLAAVNRSQALAGAAQLARAQDPMRALLLGIEAGGAADTPQAFLAIRQSMTQLGWSDFELAHQGYIYDAQWNHDESRILTYSADGTAKVWDAQTNQPLVTLTLGTYVREAWWNKDETRILTNSDVDTRVWDSRSGQLLLTLAGVWASWNQGGTKILASSERTVSVWDAQTGQLILTFTPGGYARARWNRDGSRILTYGYNRLAKVWDAQIWDAQTGQLLLTLPDRDLIFDAQWNRDESKIVTVNKGGMGRIWDAQAGQLLVTLAHDHWVMGALWNRDESRILTYSYDGTAKVWDARSGQLLFALHQEDIVTGALWNRDESRILTYGYNGLAKVWDAQTGRLILTLTHDRFAFAQWNQDESKILTYSFDGTAKVWDATSGAEIFTLQGDGTSISIARWNHDESQIMIATEGGKTLRYYTRMTDLIIAACNHVATRNLTQDEWKLYFPGEAYRRSCPNLPVPATPIPAPTPTR
jgi:WD40 repeat protein